MPRPALSPEDLDSAFGSSRFLPQAMPQMPSCSVFNGLFLRAFPFPQPSQLLYLNEYAPSRKMPDVAVSYEDLESWRTGTGAFEDIAGFKEGDGFYFNDGKEFASRSLARHTIWQPL
jgi:hypothetical protein